MGDAAVVEDVGNELIHAAGGGDNTAGVIVTLRRQLGTFFGQHRGEALHGAKGSAHVVGDAVGEGFEFRNCFTQLYGAFGDQLLEVYGAGRQLRVGVAQGGFGAFAIGDVPRDFLMRRRRDLRNLSPERWSGKCRGESHPCACERSRNDRRAGRAGDNRECEAPR